MEDWPRMQFKFYGISKWTGNLVGDCTEMRDFSKWAESRGIDVSGVQPFGERPTPPFIECGYNHSPCYFSQKDADSFFS